MQRATFCGHVKVDFVVVDLQAKRAFIPAGQRAPRFFDKDDKAPCLSLIFHWTTYLSHYVTFTMDRSRQLQFGAEDGFGMAIFGAISPDSVTSASLLVTSALLLSSERLAVIATLPLQTFVAPSWPS